MFPLVQYIASNGITYNSATSTINVATVGAYQVTIGFAWDESDPIGALSTLAIWLNGNAVIPAASYGYVGADNLFNMVSATCIINVTTPNSTITLRNESGGTIGLRPATSTNITSSYLTIFRLR